MKIFSVVFAALIYLTATQCLAQAMRLPNFQAYCDRAVKEFNSAPEGRSVPFDFVNYRGFIQTSEAKVKIIQEDCFANVTKRFFKIQRTNGAPISFLVAFTALGDDQYDVFAEASDCEKVFYDYTKPRMEASGVVFNDEFNRKFTDNNRNEYCPKFQNAVRDQLINVIRGIQ